MLYCSPTVVVILALRVITDICSYLPCSRRLRWLCLRCQEHRRLSVFYCFLLWLKAIVRELLLMYYNEDLLHVDIITSAVIMMTPSSGLVFFLSTQLSLDRFDKNIDQEPTNCSFKLSAKTIVCYKVTFIRCVNVNLMYIIHFKKEKW